MQRGRGVSSDRGPGVHGEMGRALRPRLPPASAPVPGGAHLSQGVPGGTFRVPCAPGGWAQPTMHMAWGPGDAGAEVGVARSRRF